MHQLCTKSFPGQDLSIPNLRRLASQTQNATVGTPDFAPTPSTVDAEDGSGEASSEDAISLRAGRSDIPLPEIVNIHQDLGCLIVDGQGEHSELSQYPFHNVDL